MRKGKRLIGLLLAAVLAIGLLCSGCQGKQAQGAEDTTAVEQTSAMDQDQADVSEEAAEEGSPEDSADAAEAAADKSSETQDAAAAEDTQADESAETQDDKSADTRDEADADAPGDAGETSGTDSLSVEEDGRYTGKEEVALYIHTFGHLPDNYITKRDAQDLGWDSGKGNLWEVTDGMSIGGNKFGNYEGNLPEAPGRQYYECDIDYTGGKRNAKRIVYSNDGLIFYTEDHYNTFEQLY